MRLAPSALAGLVIGFLLLAASGPAAAAGPGWAWDLADRNHDPAHWVWGLAAPFIDFIAGKVSDPLSGPQTARFDPGPEASSA